MPVYFKSRFLPSDDPGYDQQIAFEAMLLRTGRFGPHGREPEWSKVKPVLETFVSDLSPAHTERASAVIVRQTLRYSV
jgi:hypothetical protein